ncbi:MAG: hypothetical protein ACRDWA_05140 [Acidimicrobiia bacterium]
MNIAVIAWGSLVWDPGILHLRTRWHGDGPALPLEFARISAGGRLTLVIFPEGETRTTYWAVSKIDKLDHARSNLAEREGTSVDAIHFHAREPSGHVRTSADAIVTKTVGDWLDSHDGLDAAIWTGLTSNWLSKRGDQFSIDDAVGYLSGLRGSELDAAREYVTRAASQIDTPVRRAMRDRGWNDAALPAELFADSESRDDCS